MLLEGITQATPCGVLSLMDATRSLTARIRVSSACRCRISALFTTCTCSHWQRGSLSIHSRTACVFARFITRGRRCFFNVFYVPSARLYSAGMYLLPHLRHHNVPSSVRRDLALSSHPPLRGTFQCCTLMSTRPILTHSSVSAIFLSKRHHRRLLARADEVIQAEIG